MNNLINKAAGGFRRNIFLSLGIRESSIPHQNYLHENWRDVIESLDIQPLHLDCWAINAEMRPLLICEEGFIALEDIGAGGREVDVVNRLAP
ncbi:hypothetical protein AVEN_159323-1 [Araneus ventricosus]|uniref:Uncharacterized protein n=1 Tax=Araneus ventricosus TaxID=182803 RepID=A0A4Y2A0K3_ARAVE|nr:hypothetical protein AVEN_159323-1 [Araneus ventricosus]